MLWITLNFMPIGWMQLNAVFEHGYAYARSMAFYNTVLVWQWLRMIGDIVFAAGALLMAFDFAMKLRPLFPKRFRPVLPGALGDGAGPVAGAGAARVIIPRSPER